MFFKSMRLSRFLVLFCGFLLGCVSRNTGAGVAQTGPQSEALLQSGVSVLGEAFAYPDQGKAQATVAIVTLPPGARTALHVHDAPLIAYILEGELVVDYGEGPKTFRKGDVAIEVLRKSHFEQNNGTEPVRLLAIFTGADGVSNRKSVRSKPGTKFD